MPQCRRKLDPMPQERKQTSTPTMASMTGAEPQVTTFVVGIRLADQNRVDRYTKPSPPHVEGLDDLDRDFAKAVRDHWPLYGKQDIPGALWLRVDFSGTSKEFKHPFLKMIRDAVATYFKEGHWQQET